MQVEIDPAQWPVGFGLAEDNRYLAIEGNPMPEMRTAVLISLDGLLHKGMEGAFAIVGRLVHTNDILVEGFQSLGHLLLEKLNRHNKTRLRSYRKTESPK